MVRTRGGRLAEWVVLLVAGLAVLTLTEPLSHTVTAVVGSASGGSSAVWLQERTTAGAAATTCLSIHGGPVSTISSMCSSVLRFARSAGSTAARTATTMELRNTGGTRAARFTMAPGDACTATAGSGADPCRTTRLVISRDRVPVFRGTLRSFGRSGTTALAVLHAGDTATFTFAATFGDAASGATASLPVTWTLTS